MKNSHEEIRQFITDYFRYYLEERNFEKLKPFFSHQFTVVGTGIHELGLNFEKSMQLYIDDVNQLTDSIHYHNLKIHPAIINENLAIVYTSLDLEQDSPVGVLNIPDTRGTFTLIKNSGQWQILHIHMSVAYTEQKPGESFPMQKMNQEYAILEKMVEDRTAELKKLNEELKTANHTKDKFFSILAHDLKSPFNSLLGFTELLTEDFNSFQKEEIRPIIEAMHKSANRIYNLTENLLVWSRSQLNKIQYKPQVLHLNNLVDTCKDLLHDAAEKKNIEVLNEVKTNLQVLGDHYMLSTVIRNLISNAIKFTPDSGHVKISTVNSASEDDGRIVVRVEDSGVGIPEEHIQDIFLVGKSVSQHGTNNEKGTGLGLAICKEFINLHQSEIRAENLPSKGCRISFYLNLAN